MLKNSPDMAKERCIECTLRLARGAWEEQWHNRLMNVEKQSGYECSQRTVHRMHPTIWIYHSGGGDRAGAAYREYIEDRRPGTGDREQGAGCKLDEDRHKEHTGIGVTMPVRMVPLP
jgi:hypothetical protein